MSLLKFQGYGTDLCLLKKLLDAPGDSKSKMARANNSVKIKVNA